MSITKVPTCLSTTTLALRPLLRPSFLPQTTKRTAATTRRHTKALRLQNSAVHSNTSIPHDHIVFNPPSSTPNIYHTPLKFLPRSDPRRALLASNPLTAASATRKGPLPQITGNAYEKKYHLNAEQVAEIRRLRMDDPLKWTRNALARKFDCSPFLVALVHNSPEGIKRDKARMAADAEKWGTKRREAREDREKRRVLARRDA
ncbi:hypothetical protein EJ05DRAFT_476887 [Pseudovirgaria hyperparasitica]|uniref:60S ribosomal protein L20 n=1 Tax=Pseudovirgaria hyperparasitica TaxID=470096 RepID=A0A6A6W467_9PEZI|nr:uncharacterized protein EJ05DRAFT_476887 [Pseudovirgaria hyperparasitica]KAF2757662.1 hypothetical protein EJ05DRAFT_476887 [Pseudovirgaria hyperparasitica]